MRPYTSWDESDLQFLIDNRLGETVEREYKKTICIDKPSERKELCKDVSAMANSQGGLIIFGVEESASQDSGSIPVALSPIQDFALKEKAQQIVLDGVQPRMEFRFYSFASANGKGEYILLDVPKSFRGLHMVTLGSENRYFIRRDFQAVPMTPFEIEEAYRMYTVMENATDQRVSGFRSKSFPNAFGPNTWSAWISIVSVPIFPVRDLFVPICFRNSMEFRDLFCGTRTNEGIAGTNTFTPSFDGLTAQRSADNGIYLYEHVIFREGAVRTGITLTPPNPINYRVGALGILETVHNSISFIMGVFQKAGYTAGIRLHCSISLNSDFTLGVPQNVSEAEWDVQEKSLGMASFSHDLEFSPRDWQHQPDVLLAPLMHHHWQTYGYSRCYYFDSTNGQYDKKLVLERLRFVASNEP